MLREMAVGCRRTIRHLTPTSIRHSIGARRIGVTLALIVVSVFGVGLGLRLDGRVHQDVGPFAATFSLNPSLHGGTDVQIPPLGSLIVASHQGPAHLSLRLDSLDQTRAKRLVTDPQGIERAGDTAVPDVEDGVTRLVLQAAGVTMLTTMALAALIFRRVERVAICGALALATVAAAGAIAVGTFRPSSIEEPKYQGLLVNAPAVIGDAQSIADRFDAYRAELQGLVTNVSRLYETVSALPVYEPSPDTVRVLHISDLHLNPSAWSVIRTVVTQFHIDLVIDTGDINDWGTTMESSFVKEIGSLGVPYVYIRGNHDSTITAHAVARQPNAIVLENGATTVHGLTIAGIGDPRFTPDKTTQSVDSDSAHQAMDPVYRSGEQLATTIRDNSYPVDIALVHDPASAGALTGTVPLVLAGHLHRRKVEYLQRIPGQQQTLMLVEGSTGGAGLRGLEGETPTPLEMSVLYFDASHRMRAYDDITLGGTGESEVTLERHTIKPPTNSQAAPIPTR